VASVSPNESDSLLLVESQAAGESSAVSLVEVSLEPWRAGVGMGPLAS
jgi:hypothetical protein